MLFSIGALSIGAKAEDNRAPEFKRTQSSPSMIIFEDDDESGMRAYIKTRNRTRELSHKVEEFSSAAFIVPPEFLRQKEFVVYATDEHGNKSLEKKIYVVDGVMSEKDPADVYDSKKPEIVEADKQYRVISFKDNFALGMKAFMEYQGRKVELENLDYERNCANFIIPYGFSATIDVYAIDRDGNQSDKTKLLCSGGIISTYNSKK